MSVTALDLQALIITTLSDSDSTILTGLRSVVPSFWTLWNRQGYMPELQYWYTRRDAIRYVQAYVKGQIDFMTRNATANRNMTASSLQDSAMDAVSTESAASSADRSSSSSYSDVTNSSGSGKTKVTRDSKQDTLGGGTLGNNVSMRDTGSGANSSLITTYLESDSHVNSSSCNSGVERLYAIHEITSGVGGNSAFHYRENASAKQGYAFNVILNNSVTDSATSELEDGQSEETNFSSGDSSTLARLSDVRTNHLLQTSSQPIGDNYSNFYADRKTGLNTTTTGESHLTAKPEDNYSTYTMTGSGSGSMTGTGVGGSSMRASSTRTATGTGSAHRLSISASNMTTTMEKLHQRFLHLNDLWERANEMIDWYEKQRLALPVHVFKELTLQYPDGVNAEAANRFLIKTPLGMPRPLVAM
jgi:hypothetical protein